MKGEFEGLGKVFWAVALVLIVFSPGIACAMYLWHRLSSFQREEPSSDHHTPHAGNESDGKTALRVIQGGRDD